MRTIDYNYETSPASLQTMIDKIGLEQLLTFCQLNNVEIHRESDYMYGLQINKSQGYWGCELDAFSALIFGIAQYLKHNQPSSMTSKEAATKACQAIEQNNIPQADMYVKVSEVLLNIEENDIRIKEYEASRNGRSWEYAGGSVTTAQASSVNTFEIPANKAGMAVASEPSCDEKNWPDTVYDSTETLEQRAMQRKADVVKGFAKTINRNSLESESNTPDYVLAEYLYGCLMAFNAASQAKRGNAMEQVTDMIYSDKGLYESFQANIAMAFRDEFINHSISIPVPTLRLIANQAAKNFLDQWLDK